VRLHSEVTRAVRTWMDVYKVPMPPVKTVKYQKLHGHPITTSHELASSKCFARHATAVAAVMYHNVNLTLISTALASVNKLQIKNCIIMPSSGSIHHLKSIVTHSSAIPASHIHLTRSRNLAISPVSQILDLNTSLLHDRQQGSVRLSLSASPVSETVTVTHGPTDG
jgi:hypothetical protein